MHALERTLEDTIGYLSGLERNSNSLQDALDRSNGASSAEEGAPQRERSSNDASTPQVRRALGHQG